MIQFRHKLCLVVSSKGVIGNGYKFLFGIEVVEAGQECACAAVRDNNFMGIVYLLDVGMQSKLIRMDGCVFSSEWKEIYVVPYW